MLTGKCKELFEEWYISQIDVDFDEFNQVKIEILGQFYLLSLSAKWGVYQDFFDSLEVDLEVRKHQNGVEFIWIVDIRGVGVTKTRQEARKAAIEKANELINKE